jgi:pimeloyl-ACP methyl ester carboxylesterase
MATNAERAVGSVRLATLEAGEGGRPLLISHGFTGAKEDFADVIGPLAEAGWWVVAPDLRGHGASEQPEEEAAYSLTIFAEDLLGLTDELGWDRFALLGHSMGGMIAQELALGRPERIERLVLMSTSHGPIDELDPETVEVGVAILREQGLPALLEMLTLLPKAEPTPSEVRVRAERPGYVEFADGKVHRCSGAMYAAMGMELTSRHDRLDELAALSMPTLVIVGDEDRLMLAPSHRMAAAIPDAELVVVPDAAHSPQFENPEPWWKAVSAFLAPGLG